MLTLDRPRVRVDFNEMVEQDLVLLSNHDYVIDSAGHRAELTKGTRVYLYVDDVDDDGTPVFIVATGIAEPNTTDLSWTQRAKWCCRIDEWGEVRPR